MKKILLSLAAACTLAANAQTDVSVTAIAPAAGYTFNTTDTVSFIFGVKNEGTTTIHSNDTVYFNFSIGNNAILLVSGATANTVYPLARVADASNPAMQSTIMPDSTALFGFSLLPFSQTQIDAFDNDDVCFNVVVEDHTTGDWHVESDLSNNQACNQVTPEPVGIEEHASSFTTYPNPVINEFNIDLVEEKATLTLVDFIGRVLITEELTNGVNTIDVSTLVKGNYIYTVNSGSTILGSGKIQK